MGLADSVEAANHGKPLEGKPWPVIITFRGSEVSQGLKDACLAEARRVYLPGSIQRPWSSSGKVYAKSTQLERLPGKVREGARLSWP